MSVRVALHVHSTWSDGEITLSELRDTFLELGCRAVCMTDHAEYFTADKLADYVAESARLSDERLLLVPGLEYGCRERMHIIGYGVTELIDSDDPETVIQRIREAGGVAVIAHPHDDFFEAIERFATVPHGIEAWNSKYDGRYAPRPATFALINRMRQRHRHLHAFYGLDLHWRTQARALLVELSGEVSTREELIAVLQSGRFVGTKDDLRLPATGDVDDRILERFGVVHGRFRSVRKVLMNLRRAAGPIGRKIPAPIKRQLRRFF